MATNADGSVILDVKMNASEAENELARLKKRVFKLEGEIEEKEYNRNKLVERQRQLYSEIADLRKNIKSFDGDKFADNSAMESKIAALREEAAGLQKEIARYDDALDKSNTTLEYTKFRYGEIVELIKELQSSPELAPKNERLRLVAEAENKLNDLREQGKWFGDKEYDEAYRSLALLNSELREYQKNLSKTPEQFQKEVEVEDRRQAQIAKEAAAAIEAQIAQQRLLDIKESAVVADKKLVDLQEELVALTARRKELEEAGVSLGYEEYDKVSMRISEINRELKEYQDNLIRSAEYSKNIGKTEAEERTNAVLTHMVDLFRTAGDAASSAFHAASGAIQTAAGLAISFGKNMNAISRLSDFVGKKFHYISRMIKRTFMTFTILKGLRAIREQITNYLSVNAELSAALGTLKGVFLTAFQPIYDAAVPALITLINVISRVVAVISEFTAVLFGTTAKKAQQNAKALYGQSKALKATGSAAEDAAGSLAAFDEINTIQTENKGGGGGGGSAGGVAPDFSYDYEDTVFSSWGEAFSAFLDKMLDGIPVLEKALLGFADRMNNFAKKLYDMFTFPGVLEKVQQLGTNLANAFNNMVNRLNWQQIGRALGAGLNLALQFLVNLLYTFDWMNFGNKLAAYINGAVSEIDWYAVGKFLWAGFKISIETLAGLLLGLNMQELAEAASDLVIGFFDSMRETIDKIDWDRIGEQIRTFLTGLDWKGIITSVSETIKSALTGTSDFFSGLLGEEVKRQMTDLMIAVSEWSLALGLILALTGVNIPLGLKLISIGAATLATAAVLDFDYVSSNIRSILGEILAIAGTALLAIGIILCATGVSIPLGVSLIAAGAIGLVSAVALNWEAIQNKVRNSLDTIKTIASAALLALGVVLLFTGAFIPLGLGMLAIGAQGLASVIDPNWGGILGKLQETWGSIKSWWNGNVAKYFKYEYWKKLGTNMVDGILAGLRSIFSGLTTWASSVWRTITNSFTQSNARASVSGSKSTAIGGSAGRSRAALPDISTFNIPALARGAVIPANREFLAVLGDQKNGNNLEAPEELIRKIVREESGGGNEVVVSILQSLLEAVRDGHIIMVDGMTFGRTAIRTINNITTSSGKQQLKL